MADATKPSLVIVSDGERRTDEPSRETAGQEYEGCDNDQAHVDAHVALDNGRTGMFQGPDRLAPELVMGASGFEPLTPAV